jgi:hypothetical protein
VYGDVAIERGEDSLLVTFAEASVDNQSFFTHFILPSTITQTDLMTYTQTIATTDVGSGCARLRE